MIKKKLPFAATIISALFKLGKTVDLSVQQNANLSAECELIERLLTEDIIRYKHIEETFFHDYR